jgi:hypothetical protein
MRNIAEVTAAVHGAISPAVSIPTAGGNFSELAIRLVPGE